MLALALLFTAPPDPGRVAGPRDPMERDAMLEASIGPALQDTTALQLRSGVALTLEGDDFRGAFGVAGGYTGPMPSPSFEGLEVLQGISHFVTAGPQLRLGLTNHFAWGYGVLGGGYTHRVDRPRCSGCVQRRTAHGAFVTAGLGGLVPVTRRLWLGGEVRIDHTFALDRALWTQTYVLEFTVAFDFIGNPERTLRKRSPAHAWP